MSPPATGEGPGGPDPRTETELGTEPDYRFTLANERTFLAWLRTALAFLAAAVAVVHLLPPLAVPGGREALGVALAVVSVVCALGGVGRWQVVQAAMRADEPLPQTRLPWVLTAAFVAVAALAAALLVAQGVR